MFSKKEWQEICDEIRDGFLVTPWVSASLGLALFGKKMVKRRRFIRILMWKEVI